MPVPIDQVMSLRNQGYDDNSIYSMLQEQGFTVDEIQNAFSQVDVKSRMDTSYPDYGNMQGMTPPGMEPPAMGMPGMGPVGIPGMGSSGGQDQGDFNQQQKYEQIAEAIIDEKWNELIKQINKILEWKETIDQTVGEINQKITDLKTNFHTLQEGVLGKVGEYDNHITDVSTELKAMEKVFQKVLPQLTQDVNELSRITKSIRKQ